MDYYGWSWKKKLGFLLFVGAAAVIGGLLYIQQSKKGCPIACWSRQQEALRQEEVRQVESAPVKGRDYEKRKE